MRQWGKWWGCVHGLSRLFGGTLLLLADCTYWLVTRKAKYSKLLPIEVADSKQPLQKAIVNLDDVTIIISKDGYEDIIILADNFAAFNQRSLVPVKVASGSWWKYANRAVSNQIKSCILETC
ncbi:hypothetical protein JHK82_049996 [Glycine max]|nr:hypothetical protein JHK86_049872 [Glycine max]KAG5091218.1 hypothetical protein JHK82_049996 [Glycine max]